MKIDIAPNDIALAAVVGTIPKSLWRWRQRFPEAPKTRDVEAWKKFMADNCLGPYSAQRRSEEEELSEPHAALEPLPAPAKANRHDTEEQALLRRFYVDGTMTVGALRAEAETYFPGNADKARAELAKISAAAERLYDLAGLESPDLR